jgi:tetratricopeptide (TPR) repeat protein
MVKKSDLKKLNSIMQEGNEFKNQKQYNSAIEKYLEALRFVEDKVKDPIERDDEMGNIKSQIDQVYSVEIIDIIERANDYYMDKKFDDTYNTYKEAMRIADKIVDKDMRDYEVKQINYLIEDAKIKQLIYQATVLFNEEEFSKALNILKDALNTAKSIHKEDPTHEMINNIQNVINKTYSGQVQLLIDKANQLKVEEKFNDAVEVYQEALIITEKYFESELKTADVINVKNLINQVFSIQIKPILERGKSHFDQNNFQDAVKEFENALEIAYQMYESPQKQIEVSQINTVASKALNPVYLERIKPILDKARELIIKENFQQKINMVNEALGLLEKALEIANKMANSSEKDDKLTEVTDLIKRTCRIRITYIKDNALRKLAQKEYEKAVNDLYAAISIAKRMPVPEEQNQDLEDLKGSVNKAYIAQIDEVVKKGNEELRKNNYEAAIKIFNEALVMTNKMYLTEEMENEVNKIKSLIYQVELKQLVGRGDLAEELQKYEKEIERLTKKMEYAKTIDDKERKFAEMGKIKDSIDEVYHSEIKLLVEQGNQLADKEKFEEAFKNFERAITINYMIESPVFKNKIAIKYEYKYKLIQKAKLEIARERYDTAIVDCNQAIELDNSFVKAYFYIGIANIKKNDYSTAIEFFKKALELNSQHVKSWNHMGVSYEKLADFDNAINAFQKAVNINPSYSEAFFNMGNSFKYKEQYDKAIDSYKKATEINTEFANAWFFLGAAYFDKKDYNKAMEVISKAIEINPKLGDDINLILNNLKNDLSKLDDKLAKKFLNQ